MTAGFIIAAPHSGSGKTTVTLGLLRALKRRDKPVGPAKAGPDFIDPAFHSFASGVQCVNLDPWAMRPELIGHLAAQQMKKGALIVEAMMGLFDGAADGNGSAADLAQMLSLPVVLVVDAAKQSHSIAALVSGFKSHRAGLQFAGVILNKVGSPRHATMLHEALSAIRVPVLGTIYRDENLALPSRHLGLVQAGEHDQLESFLNQAADVMDQSLNMDTLMKLGEVSVSTTPTKSLAPLGNQIAVARDSAFAFSYPHILEGWKQQGAELSFFSPINDEAPEKDCDAVYLPGGYPELHGARIGANSTFKSGLKSAADRGAFIYGECGGYMILGEGLIDAEGSHHEMAGLLPLVTSFEKRKLHLGYRVAQPINSLSFASDNQNLTAHEFRYSTIVEEGKAEPLFKVQDARGEDLGSCGLHVGNVAGSYMHIIDRR